MNTTIIDSIYRKHKIDLNKPYFDIAIVNEMISDALGEYSKLEWKDMKLAPKDGTFILVYDREGIYIVAWLNGNRMNKRKEPHFVWAISETWEYEYGNYLIIDKPLGWKYLPETPK